MTVRFVLASASPARLKSLHAAGVWPEVVVSGVDEDAITASRPVDHVQLLADAKAYAVVNRLREAATALRKPTRSRRCPGGGATGSPAVSSEDLLVLGCDSLLELAGVGLGKPVDVADARARWAAMAGRDGVLHTGHRLVRLRDGATVAEVGRTSSTVVRFGVPTEDELAAYLGTGEPLAVAGAFTIDGLGGWWVDGIDGDPGTVVGLSLPVLRELLHEVGVRPTDLW